MSNPSTRAEWLEFAKKRALEFVELGDNPQAYASLVSDLAKHEGLRSSLQVQCELGFQLLINGHLRTKEKMREWIEGFK